MGSKGSTPFSGALVSVMLLRFRLSFLVMNLELRERFVDSIEYLRRLDFFKDYSDLSSEDFFEELACAEHLPVEVLFVDPSPDNFGLNRLDANERPGGVG